MRLKNSGVFNLRHLIDDPLYFGGDMTFYIVLYSNVGQAYNGFVRKVFQKSSSDLNGLDIVYFRTPSRIEK